MDNHFIHPTFSAPGGAPKAGDVSDGSDAARRANATRIKNPLAGLRSAPANKRIERMSTGSKQACPPRPPLIRGAFGVIRRRSGRETNEMKQMCHTWIALRALGLIQDDPKTQDLVHVLVPWAKHSYIGCWLPDMQKFKKGHGIIGNHTFKNAPYAGKNNSRFVVPKQKLLDALDPNLALHGYISSNSTLDASWWNQPYKAEQKDGEHLPDCLSSLFDTIADMLLLGDPELDALVPGSTGYGDYLDPACTLTKEQVSTFFFIMSHYIADCFMPCHADKRKLAAFETDGVHEGWEKHWEKLIGTEFKKTKLRTTLETSEQVIDKAKDLDTNLGLTFTIPLTWPDNDNDIWETAIFWCRASFAFSCNIFPIGEYPYVSQDQPLFNEYFTDAVKLAEYDRIVLQSAVYEVASTWKQIWRKFKE